jgi:hypothetical protein
MREPPKYRLPPSKDSTRYFGEIYVQYPSCNVRTPIFHGMMLHSICKFRVIMNDLGARIFDDTNTLSALSLRDAYEARDRLRDWYNNLPDELKPHRIAIPSHLKIQ